MAKREMLTRQGAHRVSKGALWAGGLKPSIFSLGDDGHGVWSMLIRFPLAIVAPSGCSHIAEAANGGPE